ncbi:MAG: glycosyltransferase [Polyangia bacterium]
MPDSNPLVSIVIPTFGRPALLRQCVEAARAQRCPFPYEIVVIDDGGTPAAAETLADIIDPRLTLKRMVNGGPAKARNEGIRLARGTFVAFTDDDCIPDPDWVRVAVEAFADDVSMVQGSVAPPQPASPLTYHFIETGNQPCDVTANLVGRRQALLAIGGFDEGFPYAAAEDYDLCWRLERVGKKRFAPNARVVHALIPITWQRRRSRARVMATYFRLYGLHPDRLKTIGLPGTRWARAALLNLSPPLWIGTYVALVPFLDCLRNARRSAWSSVLAELAATMLNLIEAVGLIGRYRREYNAAVRDGGRPGLLRDGAPQVA